MYVHSINNTVSIAAGVDFIAINDVIGIGSATFPYSFDILDDVISETTETFNLVLSVPAETASVVVSGPGPAETVEVDPATDTSTVTILDNDCKFRVHSMVFTKM